MCVFSAGRAAGSGELSAGGAEQPEGAETAAGEDGQHSHRADAAREPGEPKTALTDLTTPEIWQKREDAYRRRKANSGTHVSVAPLPKMCREYYFTIFDASVCVSV